MCGGKVGPAISEKVNNRIFFKPKNGNLSCIPNNFFAILHFQL
jgi:hypothetical protein